MLTLISKCHIESTKFSFGVMSKYSPTVSTDIKLMKAERSVSSTKKKLLQNIRDVFFLNQ